MRKFAGLILLLIFLAANADAQLRMGLRGGINTAYFDASELTTEEYRFTTLDGANTGFHGGVFMQISFFKLFLQPELLLSSIDSKVEVKGLDQNSAVEKILEQSYTKLDFPVIFGRRFGPVRVGVGPVGTIMLATKSELDDFDDELNIEEQFNSATFGYQAGVGLDIKFIAIDLKYEGNLSKLGDGIRVAGQDREFDSRSRQFIVSLGIFF